MTTEKENPDIVEDLDFELIIGDAGGQIDNGDVPIRWCMKPDFVIQLEARGVEDPHVLIASFYPDNNTENYSNEMDRKLVPLSELMTYLRFTKAGKNRVVGILLDGSEGRKYLWDRYMSKHRGDLVNIVSSWDGEIHKDIQYSVVVTSDFVDIPSNVFGREPSPWIKWYVNLWHNAHNKITDECDFRKRFLIAFIFKWMAFIPFITALVSMRIGWAGGVWLCGYFGKVRFLRVFRPYEYPSMEYNVFDGDIHVVNDNKFVWSRPCIVNPNTKTKMIVGLAFTPIVLLALTTIIAGFMEPNGVLGFMAMMGGTVSVILGILLALDALIVIVEVLIKFDIGGKIGGGIFSFIGTLLKWVASKGLSTKQQKIILLSMGGILALIVIGVAFKYLLAFLGALIVSMGMMFGFFFLTLVFANQILDWLDKYFAMSAKDNTYGNITELLCPKDEDNLRPNYEYIPKKQRTVRLWFKDVKNKVCKPMQS